MPQSGFLIRGRYRLDERIAAGGVGQVWRATDQVLQRPVAVKLLRPQYSDHPETLARFRTEARLAGSITHPGVAQVYDYGESGGPYLVMELVDGPSLAKILDHGPLGPLRTADIIAQAAAGLEAAHRAGLVHRDIKPENLLLGPGGQVKITDFGIAHATGSAPLTGSGVVMGTTPYLAPERAIGGPGTAASDLYSLGIVGYECLTGSLPFDGTRIEIMASHVHRQLPQLPAEVPPELADLINLMAAKDPAQRPANAAVVAEYAGQLRDAMIAGRPPSPTAMALSGHPRVDTFVPRRRLHAMAVTAAAVAVIAAAVLVVPGLLSAGSGQSAAQAGPVPSGQVAATGSPAQKTVLVNGVDFAGQPLNTVLAQLRSLGLQPLLEWSRSGTLPTGTVIYVMPTGAVTRGSMIMVMAAYRLTIPQGAGVPSTTAQPSARPRSGQPAHSPSGSSSPASSPSSSSPGTLAGSGSSGGTSGSGTSGSGSGSGTGSGGLLGVLGLPGLGSLLP